MTIFLKGIFMEMYDKKEEEEITVVSDEKDYGKLPRYYKSKEEWPATTNIPCWNCMKQFSGRPWFLPLQMNIASDPRNNTETYEIYTEGCFCHIACVGGYMSQYFSKNKNKALGELSSEALLIRIFFDWTGKRISGIPLADPPHVRKLFSGNEGISDQEYDRNNEEKLKMYILQRSST